MSSMKFIMNAPESGMELFPHNFADQTWVGRDTFASAPHNLVDPNVFYSWYTDTNGVFQDINHLTGYISDGSLYTTDTMNARNCVGILTSVDAGDAYVIKYTNKFTGLTGVLHWLDSKGKEISNHAFSSTGREFVAPEKAVQAAIGFKGAAAINTRLVANFGVITKSGQSVQDWIDGVIDGSIQVGNALTLDGHTADFFYYRSEAEKLISDLKDGTMPVYNSLHLDGHPASYFLSKAEFNLFKTDLENGSITVNNTLNLGGKPAGDYLLVKDAVKVFSGTGAPGVIAGAKLNDLYIRTKQ